jgi:hypothetical protein
MYHNKFKYLINFFLKFLALGEILYLFRKFTLIIREIHFIQLFIPEMIHL